MILTIYENHLYILERILRLRFKAAKAAIGSTPSMNGGACTPLFGQDCFYSLCNKFNPWVSVPQVCSKLWLLPKRLTVSVCSKLGSQGMGLL
jgi:hypothetical protein